MTNNLFKQCGIALILGSCYLPPLALAEQYDAGTSGSIPITIEGDIGGSCVVENKDISILMDQVRIDQVAISGAPTSGTRFIADRRLKISGDCMSKGGDGIILRFNGDAIAEGNVDSLDGAAVYRNLSNVAQAKGVGVALFMKPDSGSELPITNNNDYRFAGVDMESMELIFSATLVRIGNNNISVGNVESFITMNVVLP